MKALLLNSGVGSRMGNLTVNKAKSMCEIGNGYTILSWQLKLLEEIGIRNIIITTGAFHEDLKESANKYIQRANMTFIYNPLFHQTNYIYSMYLAKSFLKDDIILLHGDLVIEKSILLDLQASPKSVVVVDESLPLPEKDFKAKIENGKVSAIGLEYFDKGCVACQPAYKFLKDDFECWMEEIEKFCNSGRRKVYAEEAFNLVHQSIDLYPMNIKGRLCQEVDLPEDLDSVTEKIKRVGESIS